MTVVKDERVQRLAAIIQEALEVPTGRKRRAWIETVAVKHGISFATIYRNMKRYQQAGLAGLKHMKPGKGRARSWSEDALQWWLGLCLKREHRKVSHKELYRHLVMEAQQRGWAVGSERSAYDWYNKMVSPQLEILQCGGTRALDNSLPPILRDYSDLAPFEILVGDQHRFDFWVVDDETGEVFRPEAYLWQDLRTRLIYGAAVAKRYDSFLVGLALRIGIRAFGAFKSIYTDNGKPELSRYVMGIMKDMAMLGMACERETDLPLVHPETEDSIQPEEVSPLAILPGTHRKAIVRNAKAKMIESTNCVLEGILRSRFLMPGNVKDLGGLKEENEIDEKELSRLAIAGKLITFDEFVIRLYQALDYYNREKAHAGVLKEWIFKPRPKEATPMQCLEQCYNAGWRPRRISEQAVDLIFLPKGSRTVNRGMIKVDNSDYSHDALVELHGQKVTYRYDPMDPGWLLVFHGGEFRCIAHPVQTSSMKDQELASRRIEEKRRMLKSYVEEYRSKVFGIPDIREYSAVPRIEKAAALIDNDRKAIAAERAETGRVRTEDELAAEVAKLEAAGTRPRTAKPLPARPALFLSELARYKWIVDFEVAGGGLQEADVIFKAGYESRLSEADREYWDTVRALGGQ